MAERVCIGIHVHAEPQALAQSVRFVALHTDPHVQIVLLPDGPDNDTRAALETVPELAALPQWGTDAPLGAPACFNRLAANSDTAILVLLESGSLVGPLWLERLEAALCRPECGLAGPSTNRAWNEQAVFPRASDSLQAVRDQSAVAFRLYGDTVQSLEPLHSLSDFCYAVRRDVVEAIGAADEEYGCGPCWEMDYNVRAARAGLQGFWVGGAYVFRHALTARRSADEQALRKANLQRYQDRFCGLRQPARGAETLAYQRHCRGEECEHFAPPGLVTLTLPISRRRGADRRRPGTTVSGTPSDVPNIQTGASAATTARRPPAPGPAVDGGPGVPLVSCLMPTRERGDFAAQAVRYFLRQDYPNTELVIVDDAAYVAPMPVPEDPRIRLFRAGADHSIGAMRNAACAKARGQILVLWDDDDWHGSERVSRQVAPILAGECDISALRDVVLLDVKDWRCWRWSTELHSRLLAFDVLGGTIAFDRSVWDQLAHFPDVSLAEDAAFVTQAVGRGARLRPIDAGDLYIYVRHWGNSWRLDCGRTVDRAGWQPVREPELSDPDRFYRALHAQQ
jgi:GT2 family glycosyltransferase